MTKRIPKFYIILLAVVVAVVLLTQIGTWYAKGVLEEYENSQYKYTAEEFFDNNFVAATGNTIAELFKSQLPDIEDEQAKTDFFNTIIEGKEFKLQHSSSGMSENEKYIVSLDNLKFAEFFVTKASEKTKHGFDTYAVSEIVLNDKILNTYSIEIPVGYSLKVNGNPASEAFALGDRIETESFGFMPEGIDGIVYTTYTFINMCEVPEFSVIADNGAEAEIIKIADNKFKANIVNDAELEKEFASYIIDATKAYACYMQKDASFSRVSGYLDPASDFYKYVKSTPTWPVITHNSYGFENAKVSEFYAYSDDVISCRITITHILKYSGLEDYNDSIDITWYLRKVNNKFLIYDSFTH